jgi:DNA-binding LytR/AlgR family response regulator
MTATALIAEDEPLLAQTLQRELLGLWPGLRIVALAGDGVSAVALSLEHLPDVVFLDIRMPGQDGLTTASDMLERWPTDRALPHIVFVTAHDEYALQAFEAQAIDYVLKPVRSERLARTVQRLQSALQRGQGDEATLASLRALLQAGTAPAEPPLRLLQAGVGQQLQMVAVDQVLLLEAADKYVRALTRDGRELWLRTPLRELLARLDPEVFWQIHRGTVVRAEAITSASRDAQGQWQVQLDGLAQPCKVSRLFAHRFKAM